MSSESERRVEARAPIELKIEYKTLNTFFADYTTNLSARGTFIRTLNPLPIGTLFTFKLMVPQIAEPIALRGVVRWVRNKNAEKPESLPGMGIEFEFDDDAQFEALRTTVESLMTSTLGKEIAEKLLSTPKTEPNGPRKPNT